MDDASIIVNIRHAFNLAGSIGVKLKPASNIESKSLVYSFGKGVI